MTQGISSLMITSKMIIILRDEPSLMASGVLQVFSVASYQAISCFQCCTWKISARVSYCPVYSTGPFSICLPYPYFFWCGNQNDWCGLKLCPNHAHPLGLRFILGRTLLPHSIYVRMVMQMPIMHLSVVPSTKTIVCTAVVNATISR